MNTRWRRTGADNSISKIVSNAKRSLDKQGNAVKFILLKFVFVRGFNLVIGPGDRKSARQLELQWNFSGTSESLNV